MIAFKPHTGAVYAAVFSPDGRYLATSSADQTVAIAALDAVAEPRRLPGSGFACPLAFSHDGTRLARGGRGLELWDWSKNTDKPLWSDVDSLTQSLAFAKDDRILAGQAERRALLRWTVATGARLPGAWGTGTPADQFPTECLAYSPDGSIIASSFGVHGNRGYDSVVFLWDAKTGAERGRLHSEFRSAHPTAIAFSADGQLLAGIYGPALNVFDVASAKRLATASPSKKHFKGLAFTADGRGIATTSNDKIVRIWDARTLTERSGFEWKIGKLGAIAVSPDGLRMAAGGDTGKVIVWDVD